MTKGHQRIRLYEKEILELKEQGLTQREIGEKFGFSREQIKSFFRRYYKKQRKIAAEKALKTSGRSPEKSTVREDKIAQLKYIISQKDAKIKRLEMETELMRDFLSHTERK